MLEDTGFDEDKPDAQPMGRIGDEEQYAALTAVMARSIGMPARVVMGFEVPEGQEGTVSLTGDDVTAWVEVAFDDLGWVRFDPAPDEDEDPTEPQPKEVEKPLPQVAQPPPPPAEPPTPPPGAMSDESEEDDPLEESVSWVVYAGLALLPLLLVGLAVAAVLIAKSVRRGRRRTRGALPARVDGGWQEIVDLLADMGKAPEPLLTRTEIVARLRGEIPEAGLALLAARADRAVFGPDDLPEAAGEAYWDQVMETRRGMTAALPWHRRLRTALSLRSFRRQGAERRRENRRRRVNARARAKALRRTEALRRRRTSARDATARSLWRTLMRKDGTS